MLSAILHGKAGRIKLHTEETKVRWREIFRCSEDLLSAVFFSRLRYLSPQSTTRVMALLVGTETANQLGELKSLQLWSRLAGTQGRSWVEPDVQMHFDNGLVVVEVKPPFGGVQYIDQWRAQIQALALEMDDVEKVPPQFHFVALGNNTFEVSTQPAIDFGVSAKFMPTLHQAEWDPIAEALSDLRAHVTGPDKAVFEDWLKAFALFGITVQPQFKWPELLTWAQQCGLSIAQIDWPVWSHSQQKACGDSTIHPKVNILNWASLQDFSLSHPLLLLQ